MRRRNSRFAADRGSSRSSSLLAWRKSGKQLLIARSTSLLLVGGVGITIGSRVPAHCVSTGRVLLAALADDVLHQYLDEMTLTRFTPNTITSKVQLRGVIGEVRLKGWSIVDQELEVGLRSLSVPIRDGRGKTVAAPNVCCPSARITPEDMRTRVLAETLEASTKITGTGALAS